jgi:hypothetical protein
VDSQRTPAVPFPRSGNNLFFNRIPSQHASGAIGVHKHAASEGHAEAQVERTIRLAARMDAVKEILDVGDIQMLLALVDRPPQDLGPIGSINLLRSASNLFVAEDRLVSAQHVFGLSQFVVSEGRVPVNIKSSPWTISASTVSGTSRPSFQRKIPPLAQTLEGTCRLSCLYQNQSWWDVPPDGQRFLPESNISHRSRK